MNNVVTSKEEIIAACRKISAEKGIKLLSIREIAQECGVAVGSVYNYFPSKSELIVATVEDIWKSVFHSIGSIQPEDGFVGCVRWIFSSMRAGSNEYPSFFTMHSMNFSDEAKNAGRKAMHSYFEHIKDGLKLALAGDTSLRLDAFCESFTIDDFIGFVFSNVISLVEKNQTSCEFLVEIISRTIY